jgi:hypothetical protein
MIERRRRQRRILLLNPIEVLMIMFGLDACDVCFSKSTQDAPMLVVEVELRDGPETTTNLAPFATRLFIEQKLVRKGLESATLRNLVENSPRAKSV